MTKKSYITPRLKTEKVELGVFGTYQNLNPNGKREPLAPVTDLDLRIE